MIVYDYLKIVVSFHFRSRRAVSDIGGGIYVNDFAIPLVFEQEPFLLSSNDLKINIRIWRWFLCLPVVVTQIGRLWDEAFFLREIRRKVFRFESIRVIDVPTHFVTFVIPVSDEDNRSQFAVSY